jgi:hypothetical protein
MSGSPSLRLRVVVGVLLSGFLAAGSGLHHREDLASVVLEAPGAPLEQVRSDHNPLARDTHWHAGVSVKEDPCLACAVHRLPGLAALTAFAAILQTGPAAAPLPAIVADTVVFVSNGSRAPPVLL